MQKRQLVAQLQFQQAPQPEARLRGRFLDIAGETQAHAGRADFKRGKRINHQPVLHAYLHALR